MTMAVKLNLLIYISLRGANDLSCQQHGLARLKLFMDEIADRFLPALWTLHLLFWTNIYQRHDS